MRAVVQRVSRARVEVEGKVVGAIERGLAVFLGVVEGDTAKDAGWIAHKLLTLRIFEDAEGKMNLSVLDVCGSMLLVSRFTVCADVGKGARPSFTSAMAPDAARATFDAIVADLRRSVPVATGCFGAHMEVTLTNEGPVTFWLDSRRRG